MLNIKKYIGLSLFAFALNASADTKADTIGLYGYTQIQTCIEMDIALLDFNSGMLLDKEKISLDAKSLNSLVDYISLLREEEESFNVSKDRLMKLGSLINTEKNKYEKLYTEYKSNSESVNANIRKYNLALETYNTDCSDFKYEERDLDIVCEDYKDHKYSKEIQLCKD